MTGKAGRPFHKPLTGSSEKKEYVALNMNVVNIHYSYLSILYSSHVMLSSQLLYSPEVKV